MALGDFEICLTGNRVALLVEDLYQEMEVWYPIYRLLEECIDQKAVVGVSADYLDAEVVVTATWQLSGSLMICPFSVGRSLTLFKSRLDTMLRHRLY
jgi:hypothetical protein